MKNINSKILAIARTNEKEQTKTRLDQAYERIDRILQNSDFYIENATDFKGDSIYMTIAGNINEQLPDFSNVAQLTKTKTKNNKVFLTLRLFKKNFEQNKPIEQKKTIESRIQKINNYVIKCNTENKKRNTLFYHEQKEIEQLREQIKQLEQIQKDLSYCRRIIRSL